MSAERRINRSNEMPKALELQLVASSERAQFNSLSLAEEHGLLVAAAGDPAEWDEIAALSPHIAGHSSLWHGQVRTSEGPKLLTVALVESDQSRLYLAAVGGRLSAIVPELLLSCKGVHRILA